MAADPSSLPFLPYARQTVTDADVDAVAAVLRSDWLTTGPAVDRFEAALADACGAAHAVSCATGTAALHLAALAAGLGPGDAAIVPAITFMATANAVCMTGAVPVFADVDPETGLMTPAAAAAAADRAAAAGLRVAAVMPVHLAGQCLAPEAMQAFAAARGAVVIEDACHALGAAYRRSDGRTVPVGACRDSLAATFSFHPAKTVACGEGGAVLTDDAGLADRMRRLRAHGIERLPERHRQPELALAPDGQPNPWYHEMQALGWNYRLSDIQAALGTSQLDRLPALVAARRELADLYDTALSRFDNLAHCIARVPDCEPAWHLYPALIDFAAAGTDRGTVMRRLQAAGIGAQVHYIPVPWQPWYRDRWPVPELPGAAAYYARTLSLPFYPGLGPAEVERVAAALAASLGDGGALQDR
ncbi:UDP-4-amino-4,6-dideoxy-N-acetyl-beta-L-altrosamine transaminase [Marinibaculum pumilum]|uniref:UDP-4-amino-4, 6-dideoxy-N-acetyl-beta-L-altrosamine transaminase n=1 Tax=Marinibaculum pumilum TaxID=1766165 RepID=A0ABV7KYP3_9PROT